MHLHACIPTLNCVFHHVLNIALHSVRLAYAQEVVQVLY